jgi:predicted ArsR family transcriptional regulator
LSEAALDIIDDPARARTALHPLRRRILQALDAPASAPQLARTLGLGRQQVNYHLRRLEADRLVQAEDAGRVGRRIDRLYRRTAASYLLAPTTVAGTPVDPRRMTDRFSTAYLTAVSARALNDIAALRRAADREGKRIPTLTLDTEVRFATPAAQRAFADALTQALSDLVERFHDAAAPGGRTFRIFACGYPAVRDRHEDASHDRQPDAH